MDRFLKPYGAQVLHEQVAENDRALTLPTMGISPLGYTDNITPGPLTEGVRGLLYPNDHMWSYWTHALQVDTERGDRSLYIGNLLVCDQPGVFLELEDARPGQQTIMVNNPTDRALTVTVKPGPGLDLLPAFSKTLTVKTGEVVRFVP